MCVEVSIRILILTLCCIISKWERVKGNWGRKSRPNFALISPLPLYKLVKGGQNVWVIVSSSAEDPTSDILLVRGRCACWGLNTISFLVFHGRNIPMPNFLRVKGQPRSNLEWKGDTRNCNLKAARRHASHTGLMFILLIRIITLRSDLGLYICYVHRSHVAISK